MMRSMIYRTAFLLGTTILSNLPMVTAAPQSEGDGQSQPESTLSLDDELLKELESDLGEDAAQKPNAKSKSKAPMGGGPAKKSPAAEHSAEGLLDDEALDKELLRQLQPEAPEDDNDLSKIGRAMRQVEELVKQSKSGQPTQQMQDQIVVDLDKLLEAARQRQRKSQSSSSSQQSASRQPASQQSRPGAAGSGGEQPAKESSDKLQDRTAASPDPEQMKDLLRELWGHLPEHERQMVINSTIERFLPKYELMIEAYFKRLAAEAAEK